MPELPEVDSMVTYLREREVTGTITDVRILRQNGRYLPRWKNDNIVGQKLHTVGRRGKFITFHLSDGIMTCHNAMSGYWDIRGNEWCFDYVEGARKSTESDVRVEIDVRTDRPEGEQETKVIRFHDARLFGSLRYFPVRSIEEIPSLEVLGPEAIETENVDLTIDKSMRQWNVFDICVFNMKHEIKHALMNQEAVAGFGNIYAAETLYAAKIDPFRITKTLSADEWARLFDCGQDVLHAAIKRNLDYSTLNVYRVKTCMICQSPITNVKLRGRSTYFCPSCQR